MGRKLLSLIALLLLSSAAGADEAATRPARGAFDPGSAYYLKLLQTNVSPARAPVLNVFTAWGSITRAIPFLHDRLPHLTELAATYLRRGLSDADNRLALTPTQREQARGEVLAHLVRLGIASPALQSAAFAYADTVDAASADCVLPLLRGIDSDEVDARARAFELADLVVTPRHPQIVRGFTAVASLNTPHASEAIGLLISSSRGTRHLAANYALHLRALGFDDSDVLLAALGLLDSPAARVAAAIGGTDPSLRPHLVPVLDTLAFRDDGPRAYQPFVDAIVRVGPELRDETTRLLAGLLAGKDPDLRLAAANVLAADPVRLGRTAAVEQAILHAATLPPDVLRALQLGPVPTRALVLRILNREDSEGFDNVRVAALEVLGFVGFAGDELATAVAPLCASPNRDVRLAAARLLGRKDVLARDRLPGLLRSLRSPDPAARVRAAHEIDRAEFFPPPFTAALVRATARRDMAAREGLTLALERALADGRDPAAVLATIADSSANPDERAYARAARRELTAR